MRLLIVRNAHSPVLDYADLDAPNVEIVLVQNGVYSERLRAKNALSLQVDAKARKLDLPPDKLTDFDGLLEAIFLADNVLVV
ncbi:MAG: hypothetical protein HY098_06860 [Nitrospinae bacterium]|nr:hypothetical protein [Nitrospinota bacterium]